MTIALFDFYQEVRIRPLDPAKAHLHGEAGVVLGVTATDDQSSWNYAISLWHRKETWSFFEGELEPTGRQFTREDFYDGTAVKVDVDRFGRGTLSRGEDEDEK